MIFYVRLWREHVPGFTKNSSNRWFGYPLCRGRYYRHYCRRGGHHIKWFAHVDWSQCQIYRKFCTRIAHLSIIVYERYSDALYTKAVQHSVFSEWLSMNLMMARMFPTIVMFLYNTTATDGWTAYLLYIIEHLRLMLRRHRSIGVIRSISLLLFYLEVYHAR